MSGKEPEDKSSLRQLLEASSVGIQFVLSTFAGIGIGYLIDTFLGTFPWLTIVFFLCGIAAGFYDLVRVARKQNDTGKKSS
ncbi:MAG: AtpZ/AtpI family protein [Nitrospirae bacterium]|nr:AtpZ/AtpI family protein [Nitrospirota bacterium]